MDGPAPFTPGFLQEAYDTGWLSAVAGAGTTIAIVDAYDNPNTASDLDEFRATFGLPAISHSACSPSNVAGYSASQPCMLVVNQNGQTQAAAGSNWPSTDPSPPPNWADEESLDVDAVSSMCPNCNILLVETNGAADSDLANGNAAALELGVKLISDSFGGPGSGDGDGFTAAEDRTGDQGGSETFAATGDSGAYVDDAYPGQTANDQVPYPASEPGITAVGGTTLNPSSDARGIEELAWSGAGSACSTLDAQPNWQASVDTGCSGRAVADVSADADPNTGLWVYDSSDSGWLPVGGTSLAAPLTAAYTALTGVNSGSTSNSDGSLSAEWAYADAAQLNDITSGSNGAGCSGSVPYASPQTCNAGPGWDGPTGMGSISGEVLANNAGPSLTVPPSSGFDNGGNGYSLVQSPPTDTTATFDGGAYPNGSPTTVWWEYGTALDTRNGSSFAAAASTPNPPSTAGSGTDPVMAPSISVTDLTPSTVYFVEECASNNGGTNTVCGNDTEFTTAPGPAAGGWPILGSDSLGYGGQIEMAFTPTWIPASGTSVQYQWQESPNGASDWTDVGSASSSQSTRYTIGLADSLQYIRIEVIATDNSGSTMVYSNPARVNNLSPVARTGPILSATSLGLGGVIGVANPPSWSPGSPAVTYQWQESSDQSSWSNLGSTTISPSSYTIQQADSQQYIRVAVTATDPAGTVTVYSAALHVADLSATGSGAAGPQITTLPILKGARRVGATVSVNGGRYANAGSVTITFERCARSCKTLQSGGSNRYRLRSADAGSYLVVIIRVAGTGSAANVTATASGLIGPISSQNAGAVRITKASATVRSGKLIPLLRVTRSVVKLTKSRTTIYELRLSRDARVRGSLHAWACVSAGTRVPSCTGMVNVSRRSSFSVIVPPGDSVELIAVR